MYEKYFCRAGECNFPTNIPGIADGSKNPILYMDAKQIPDATFLFECSWLMKPFDEDTLRANNADGMIFMCGPDRNDPENLHGTVRFTMDNDVHTINHTAAIYVPAGCAHKLEVIDVNHPIMYCYCEFSPTSTSHPVSATAPAGTYAQNVVYRYEPTSGIIPDGPEGFLQLLIWMAGDKVKGAPYLELCRFMTSNDTGPEEHIHDNPEFIGFLGTDPSNPADLGAEVHFFLGGEDIATTKSTVIYVPGNVSHSPIIVPKLTREIIHFSGSPATEYVRKSVES